MREVRVRREMPFKKRLSDIFADPVTGEFHQMGYFAVEAWVENGYEGLITALLREGNVPPNLQFLAAEIIDAGRYKRPRHQGRAEFHARVVDFYTTRGMTKKKAMGAVAEEFGFSISVVEKDYWKHRKRRS